MHIRLDDIVEVLTGDDRQQRGKVLKIDHQSSKVVVEGVNRVYKHVRRGHPRSPQGGRLHVELPIDASNVQLICPETNQPTRVGVRVADDGSKELFAKRSGAGLREIRAAKK